MTTNILWTSKDAVSATGGYMGARTGEWQATGVSIDTRTIERGDLFIALKGPHTDGHDYVLNAFEKGAAAALVDRVPAGAPVDKCLVVEDTLEALSDLGHFARLRTQAKIIAVTGSVGKTGTKDMLECVFSAQCKTHASQKSYNNHWGVPLTLALMPLDTKVGIFEIGMNHPGEITPLSQMVQPDIAIITTVEAVHIENFDNGEVGIADAKAEIFEGLKPGSKALLNQNNKWFANLFERAKEKCKFIYAFGEGDLAAARMKNLEVTPHTTSFIAGIMDDELPVILNVSGAHHALNALPVLLSVKLLGYDLSMAVQALEDWQQRDGRGKTEKIVIEPGAPPVVLLDEHYNASPVAMRAAFAALGRIQPAGQGRRIAVLGDMAELGEQAATYHKDLVPDLLAANVDKVYAAGLFMKHLYDSLPEDKQAACAEIPHRLVDPLLKDLRPGDVVLVKGSRGGASSPKMLCLVEKIVAMQI